MVTVRDHVGSFDWIQTRYNKEQKNKKIITKMVFMKKSSHQENECTKQLALSRYIDLIRVLP